MNEMLAVSTEDGRVLFYSTTLPALTEATQPDTKSKMSICRAVGQLGGGAGGLTSRIKDFEILKPPAMDGFLVVTSSSDGAIRLWVVDKADLQEKLPDQDDSSATELGDTAKSKPKDPGAKAPQLRQIGKLLGTYEAGNRITCLKAFIMSEPEDPKPKGLQVTTNANKANGLELEDESSMTD